MLAFSLLSGCGGSGQSALPATTNHPLTQDAYIWQRQWTPSLAQAMQISAPHIRRWHALVAELDARGRWTDITPDWTALKRDGRPLVLTVRIEGQLNVFKEADLSAIRQHIADLLARWRAAGIVVAGLEIDHDCASARLPGYASFLGTLRAALPAGMSLSITALPTWLDSPALDALLALPDEVVLQVHAVLNPRQGLFDPKRARDWLDKFSRRAQRPWYVALPTYGTRVAWSPDGRIANIESESTTLATTAVMNELVAAPQTIAGFVAQLERERPAQLAGIVWFRLPTDEDVRAWSLPTWLAVLQRQALKPDLQLQLQPAPDSVARNVVLINAGNADIALPRVLRINPAAACRSGDGINGYALESDAQGRYLRRTRDGLLRAGRQRNVGWLNCQQESVALHVEP